MKNNNQIKCSKCKDNGFYFFSDRVPEICDCQKVKKNDLNLTEVSSEYINKNRCHVYQYMF